MTPASLSFFGKYCSAKYLKPCLKNASNSHFSFFFRKIWPALRHNDDVFYITGKWWDKLFEVRFVPAE